MGLTIHYSLQSNAASPEEARRVIEELRSKAIDLQFQEVSDLMEFEGDCSGEALERDDPVRWFLIQASQWVERPDGFVQVEPYHVIGFETDPGEGSEVANFGLCRYPPTVEILGKVIEIGLVGWCWQSFCKTQYASNPDSGGLENFLKAHLSVVAMLDAAKEMGILKFVNDEGGYWEDRDVEKLIAEIGKWNKEIAAMAGKFKDHYEGKVVSEIGKFPNFEHLEAEGEKLRGE